MSWPKVPFETIYEVSSRNGIYKTKEFHGAGVKIVNMGELFGLEFIGNQEMNRVQMSDVELERDGLVDGDLLFGRRSLVESGAGKCSIVLNPTEPLTFESSIIRVRLDKSKAIPLFYYYWFKSHIGRAGIRAIVSGTNVKGIRGSDLRNVLIALPPIDCQKRIVDVCKNYDDLIENNCRRIQLLEESARLLYKEWFVHLRFPGHEHVKIVDGVPEGWVKTNAYDVMDVLSGGTPKTGVADYWDGDIPFFTPRDTTSSPFTFHTEKTITERALQSCNSRLYPKYTLFITARGTVGKLSFAQRPMAMNQSCYALIGKGLLNQVFLYCALNSSIEQFKARASGSVFDAIVVDTFKQIPFLKPTDKLLIAFNEDVSKIFQQIDNLSIMNLKLAEARNLLLPRLMNGELTL